MLYSVILHILFLAFICVHQTSALTLREAQDENGFCTVNRSFRVGGNTCSCRKGDIPRCRQNGCPPPPIPQPAVCVIPKCSTGRFCPFIYQPVCGIKIEFQTFGNTCELGGRGCREGFRYHREGRCDAPITPTPIIFEGPEIPEGAESSAIERELTKENALDDNGHCKVNGSFLDDCNRCRCHIGSLPACTKRGCPPKGYSPPLTKADALDVNGLCIVNGSFPDDCNRCTCHYGSHPACTEKGCLPKEPACIVPSCSSSDACPRIYLPVCGVKVELRTFSNTCTLGGSGCADGFRYFKDGKCESEIIID